MLGAPKNCGSVTTPESIGPACEENFNSLFGSSDLWYSLSEAMNRLAVNFGNRFDHKRFDPRFDFSKHHEEVNRPGRIVKTRPTDPGPEPAISTRPDLFAVLWKIAKQPVATSPDGRTVPRQFLSPN